MGKYKIDNRPTPIDFECGHDLLARTIQNAKNLLMTSKGDVPYDRLRGFDVALLDLPIVELRRRLLPELDRVMLWEPDVGVESADCYFDAGGELVIEATLDIGLDGEGGMRYG